MKAIRFILGKLILFFNAIIPTKKLVKRSLEQQKTVDSQLKNYSIYQFEACPFCVKVRRHVKSLGLNMTYKDAKNDPTAREELLKNGGKIQVPCLRIKDGSKETWMYESNDIIQYLNKNFLTA
ncbi:MAG TPA: glutathione S-transferase N-terminal domain-containing protein [Oligoflexia bacterium]|nr:glutathione S-transferase N-terminal domain-containing protein [Oligoflexia bacterium]HMR25496.1 glutathione S-transferase N-terminal domain-containing protein [Oligoflexia bacterium]